MRALLLCIALTLASPLPARAAEILILQSARGPAYSEALRGFHAACKESDATLVLADYAEIDVPRLVKEERPRLVVAVGERALAAAREVREVPVVALLALSLNVQKKPAENVGGVAMVPSPEEYLKLHSSLGVKRVGIVYDPRKTAQYVARAVRESRQFGLTLVTEPISDPRELQSRVAEMKDRVDVLWIIPDSTVATRVNMEAVMLFSIANRVPVVAFSSEYLKLGAAAAVSADFGSMGRQAGEMASSLLAGGATLSTIDPAATRVHTNEPVLQKLGVKVGKPLRRP